MILFANAEIYNHREMRAELSKHGHRFTTASDCEVIVHGYEQYGCQVVSRLRGMFAFALYDANRQQLVLARDRLGEKPLFVLERPGLVAFASEMSSLLSANLMPIRVDIPSLHAYFRYQYVPEPETIICGVRHLPAGHFATISVQRPRLKLQRYWAIDAIEPLEGTPRDLVAEQLLEIASIACHGSAEMGVALSGGIDSSAIAALLHQAGTSLTGFSVGYSEVPTIDERRRASTFADRIGIPMTELEIASEDVPAQFDDVVTALDQPIADLASFGYYQLARAARNAGVKVMFLGHGGDELFWGYRWVDEAIESLFSFQSLRRDQFYAFSEPYKMAERHLGRVCSSEFMAVPARDTAAAALEGQNALQCKATQFLLEGYLRTNGIAQADRLFMSHGVEVRLPLIDYRLVEVVLGLRQILREPQRSKKAWLREAIQLVAPVVDTRQTKRPFLTPVRSWHRDLFGAFGSWILDGWLVQSGILTRPGARLLSTGAYGIGSGTSLSFKALVLERWLTSQRVERL